MYRIVLQNRKTRDITMTGWVKIYRKIIEWEWWDDHNTTRLFIYLIAKANHKDSCWRGIEIKRGQIITSFDSMSRDTGLTIQKIRTGIKRLISTNEITHNSTSKYSIITIEKYGNYQQEQQAILNTNNKQATSKQQASNNKQEYKNNKNVKNINYTFKEFWNLYDYKVGSRDKVKRKWESLSDDIRDKIMLQLPVYIKSTPDKQFRKHPSTYLNNESWNDEILSKNNLENYKLDSTGNFYVGYCGRCMKSDFYNKQDIYSDSTCCKAKILPKRKDKVLQRG